MKAKLFSGVIFVTLLTACSSFTGADMDFDINDENVGEILETQKSGDIEAKILKKLKKLENEPPNPESIMTKRLILAESTCTALGQDALDYLSTVKTYSDFEKEYLKRRVIPIIKERLLLLSLLRNYVPKNNLESQIKKRVEKYPSCTSKTFWEIDMLDKETLEIYAKVKKFTLPIKNRNEKIFVQCRISDDPKLKSVIEISLAEKGSPVFFYTMNINNSDK